MWDGFRKYIADVIVGMLASLNGPEEWLKVSDSDWMIIQVIWTYVAPLGLCVLLIYFFVDLNKTMMQLGDNFSVRAASMCYIKMIVGAVFVCYGGTLLGACIDFGNSLLRGVNNIPLAKAFGDSAAQEVAGDYINEAKASVVNALKPLGIGQLIALFLQMFIPWLLMLLVQLVIIYQAVSLKLEVIVRAGAMPLALGDIYEGKQSTAVRNIRKILALGLAGFLMMLLVKVGLILNVQHIMKSFAAENVGQIVTDALSNILQIVAIPLAIAGMCGTCKQIANDLLGC